MYFVVKHENITLCYFDGLVYVYNMYQCLCIYH